MRVPLISKAKNTARWWLEVSDHHWCAMHNGRRSVNRAAACCEAPTRREVVEARVHGRHLRVAVRCGVPASAGATATCRPASCAACSPAPGPGPEGARSTLHCNRVVVGPGAGKWGTQLLVAVCSRRDGWTWLGRCARGPSNSPVPLCPKLRDLAKVKQGKQLRARRAMPCRDMCRLGRAHRGPPQCVLLPPQNTDTTMFVR